MFVGAVIQHEDATTQGEIAAIHVATLYCQRAATEGKRPGIVATIEDTVVTAAGLDGVAQGFTVYVEGAAGEGNRPAAQRRGMPCHQRATGDGGAAAVGVGPAEGNGATAGFGDFARSGQHVRDFARFHGGIFA